MIPSIVSAERVLFVSRDRKAVFSISDIRVFAPCKESYYIMNRNYRRSEHILPLGGKYREMNEQKFKPAWRSYYRHFFVMVACFVAVLVISIKWLPDGFQKWLWLLFLTAVAYIACNMAYKRNSVLLIVRPDGIALERGIIGRQSIEISMRNIRTIQVNQSVMQRILNVGAVCVASSGTEGYEISALNMPSPHEIRQVIQINERSASKEAKNAKEKEEEHEKGENKALT